VDSTLYAGVAQG